ncbi:MAG: protein phosphatase 2C domain-containing protein [Actinobacteria bacterium]|nr:protein phosphatase 2C domain-containing protein [Actinomycetota bacterium]
MKWQFNSFAQTDLGLVREGNEDSAIYGANLIAVADGMGGHAGGEVASAIAINALAQLLPVISDSEIDIDSREDLFLNITYEIDSQILEKSKQTPELAGMGTTLTALNISGNNVELLHIGDSRCYRYRDNKLEQLSYDHTVMQELLDQGRLTPEEVFDHPQRSLLTQALMGDSGLDPILVSYEINADDQFLLCSDGLTNLLSDYEIGKIIESKTDNDLIAALISEVKAKGAPDNITIIWAQVTDKKVSSEIKKIGAANE